MAPASAAAVAPPTAQAAAAAVAITDPTNIAAAAAANLALYDSTLAAKRYRLAAAVSPTLAAGYTTYPYFAIPQLVMAASPLRPTLLGNSSVATSSPSSLMVSTDPYGTHQNLHQGFLNSKHDSIGYLNSQQRSSEASSSIRSYLQSTNDNSVSFCNYKASTSVQNFLFPV